MSDKKFKVTITGFERSHDAWMFTAWLLERSHSSRRDWRDAERAGKINIPEHPLLSDGLLTGKQNWKVKVIGDDI